MIILDTRQKWQPNTINTKGTVVIGFGIGATEKPSAGPLPATLNSSWASLKTLGRL